MTDSELIATLKTLESESLGWSSGELQRVRAYAIQRYNAEPYGNEVEGRSGVVSTDLRDTVEWIVPQWLKICLSGKKVCEFEPMGPEDEESAAIESDYINHMILQKNDALTLLSTWARDALMSKNGYVKAYWEERDDVRTESHKGLTEDGLMVLQNDPEVEIIELSQNPAEMPGEGPWGGMATYDLRVRRKRKVGKVVCANIPPEEIAIHKSTRGMDLQECVYICHRTKKTLSEIRMMGYEVDDDVTDDGEASQSDEILNARDRYDEDEDAILGSGANRQVHLTEEYARLDWDDDGIAELRRICRIGTTILANEETDLVPFSCITPIVFPHRHVGVGVDDLVDQQAQVKTVLMRQALDNLYLSNNVGHAADIDRVNIDDLLSSRPGRVVRTRGNPGDAVVPLVTPPMFAEAMAGIQWVDAWRENATGVSSYYQGMNADALNKTAQGINQIMSASQQRIEAMMRSFANGFRDLCYIVHALTLKNATGPEKLRLNNKWATVDPREWTKRTSLVVTVGLGTGSKDIRVQQLGMVWQMQMAALPTGIARPENLYETGRQVVEELGYRNSDAYFTNPQTAQPMPQQPNPDQIKAQTAIQLKQMDLQADAQKFQAQTQLELAKINAQAEAKMREQRAMLEVQAANDQRDAQREMLQAQMQARLDAIESERDAEIERLKLAVDKYQADLDAQVKLTIAGQQQAEQASMDVGPIKDMLAQLMDQVSAPAEIIRDQAGRAVGVKRGNNIRRVLRGPDGKATGVA